MYHRNLRSSRAILPVRNLLRCSIWCKVKMAEAWENRSSMETMILSISRWACNGATCLVRKQAASISAWHVWSAIVHSLHSPRRCATLERTRNQGPSSVKSAARDSHRKAIGTCIGIRACAIDALSLSRLAKRKRTATLRNRRRTGTLMMANSRKLSSK